MADYTVIPNSRIDVGEGIRAIDGLALRDNPIAIAEGAPDAPRISPWAVRTVVAAGDNVRYTDMGNEYVSRYQVPGLFTTTKRVTLLCSGTVRVNYTTLRPNSGTLTTQVVRYRGTASANQGGSVTHSSGSGSSALNRTVSSVAVLPGDSIVVIARFTSSDPLASFGGVTNFTISTDGGYLWALGGGSLVLDTEPA